jgi:hypothetical protein
MLIGKPWIDRDQSKTKGRRISFGTEEARVKKLYDQKYCALD